MIASYCSRHLKIFREESKQGSFQDFRAALFSARTLLQPLMAVIVLSISVAVSADVIGESWLVRVAQGVAFIFLVYSLARHFLQNETILFILKWVCLPLALLHIVGALDDTVQFLESISIKIGNIKISLYAVLRTVIFGVILFWLGRVSNVTGQRIIRNQPKLESGSKEVLAKLFQIVMFALIFLLLINAMGIDLTALTVFGGALGVGLGFGLQQIASNFISGMIILLDRSITIGDYIQLEDGRTGTLRELTLRSATLETYDGKDIMVPNEKFITTSFTNWTHNNKLQRYPINFQVAFKTDLEKMFPIIREVVASHPKVISGDNIPIELRPDAEIAKFGDSGVDILVEFWMEGVDDGENRVGADLLLMIWTTLKANGIEIPFPQREVKLLGEPKTD